MYNEQNVLRIGKALCMIDGIYWEASKLSGVKENLFWLLYALDDGEFHTQKQICEDWLFPKTTTNTLIKECEAAGYITLQSIPGRKRELQVCLTEKGVAFAQQTLKLVHELEERVLSKCSPAFVDDLELFALEMQATLERHREAEENQSRLSGKTEVIE